MTVRDSPCLVVVHDTGSASGFEILSSARKLCEVVFLVDRARMESVGEIERLAQLAEVCDVTGLSDVDVVRRLTELGATGVVTFSEYQLERTASLARELGLPHLSEAAVAALTDKARQRAVLRDTRVDAVGCRVVRSVAEVSGALAEVGLPAVLKPRRGAGSVNTVACHDVAAAESAVAEFLKHGPAEFVVEELLVGAAAGAFANYVSVESLVFQGDVRHVCVTGKFPLAEPFRETGCFVPSSLDASREAAVLDLAERAVRALGVTTGVTHTEIMLTDAGPRVIEVNGRLGGSIGPLVRRAATYDLARAAIELALGRDPGQPRPHFRQVAYRYMPQAPKHITKVRRIDGAQQIAEIDGVWLVDLPEQPTAADWRRGTLGHLGDVSGTTADHDELRVTIDRITEALKVQGD